MTPPNAVTHQKPTDTVGATTYLRIIAQCLRVFLAHYRHAPLQAGAILLGLALAITLLIGVKATNDNAIRSYSEATELLSQRASVLLTPPSGQSTIDEAVYYQLRQAGVSESLAVLSGVIIDNTGTLISLEGSDLIAIIQNAQSHKASSTAPTTTPTAELTQLPLGRLIHGDNLVIMSQSLADKIAPTGQLTLPPHLSGKEARVLEVIVLDNSAGLGSTVLADMSLAQRLLNQPGRLSYIALLSGSLDTSLPLSKHQTPAPQDMNDAKVAALTDALNTIGITARDAKVTLQDKGESLTALTQSFHLNLNAMSMLAFVVGLFIAYNGVRYSLLKRQKLLIQLLQLGITRQMLLVSLLLELMLLVLVGSTIGFICGLQLSHWLQPMVSVTLESLYGARLLPGIWQWHWFAYALLLAFGAALGACVPLYRALVSQPLAQGANRYVHSVHQALIHKEQFRWGVLLLIGALGLAPFSHEYLKSLILLGVVTVALPLMLPQCLHWVVALMTPIVPKGLWHYFVAETRELIAPLSLAMMAILLALSANIAMNTLVGSFEQTLRTWLENRLHADLYIRPPTDKIAQTEQRLLTQPGVSELYRQWQLSTQLHTQDKTLPLRLISRDDYSARYTSSLKSVNDDFWPAFFDGKQLMISEPMALKYHLALGDTVYIDALAGLDTTIGAIYYDHGNTQNELLISHALWQKTALPLQPISLAVKYQGDINQLKTELAQTLGLNQMQMYSQTQIKTQALTMFKRTFSITLVLNSLTLMVAAIGLFSACLMLTQARQAPLARLYALGVSRRQLSVMVFVQMLLVVAITCVLALPMGAVLGYLLIHKVTLQAFGWTIAMIWDWHAYLTTIATALFTCLLAVGLPLYWQTRRPLVASLQQETL